MANAFSFAPVDVSRRTRTIAVSIIGGSGSGKTYSALRLADGISGGDRFAVFDTENGRAMHYLDAFPNMVPYDLSPLDADGNVIGYPPERMIAMIDHAEAEGFPVVVIDSWSHSWEGIGGLLEIQAEELHRLTRGDPAKESQMKMLSWAAPKARYRRLVERVIRAQCHVILCLRGKPVIQAWDKKEGRVKNVRDTKLGRPDLAWDVAGDRDLIFEMTASFLVLKEQPGRPVLLKCADQFKSIFGRGEPITEDAGRAMAAWAKGDASQDAKPLLDAARAEARKGREAFAAHWRGLSRDERAVVNTIRDELADLSREADDLASDDAPFSMSPEDEDRIRDEAFAASDRAAEEAGR